MKFDPSDKYKPYPLINNPNRQWPERLIEKAPQWCSVDLRDGNQSLKSPMNLEEKLLFFNLLLEIGFKEIEVGFPAASLTEYDFVRTLIEDDLIPDDTFIQVLTQSKPDLIEETFRSIEGAKNVIFHLYNSTSTLQREIVFRKGRKEIIQLAVEGAKQIAEIASGFEETNFVFEYSPESFTGTELDFSLEICEAILDVWQPHNQNKIILNLPATVEMSTPNVYADLIECFLNQISRPNRVILSVHTHNDRGTGVAATELALMAGAERVEGTLFGFGERTGNVDLMTLALNLYSQGIDPKLDFSELNHISDIYQTCTGMTIHPRHPYAGELVYTAFSGSHQDAINKGMANLNSKGSKIWAVPYLPIDPKDVGRSYEKIILINSQSGKGGVAYVMEKEFGLKLPKAMHPEFGKIIQNETEKIGENISPEQIYNVFDAEYISKTDPIKFLDCEIQTKMEETKVYAELEYEGRSIIIDSKGNGPLDALGNGIKQKIFADFKLVSYSEHALNQTTAAKAIAYIGIDVESLTVFGVGVDSNISIASFKALLSALNRFLINERQSKRGIGSKNTKSNSIVEAAL